MLSTVLYLTVLSKYARSKYSNCTVNLEEIRFHCHLQACLMHHFDLLALHTIINIGDSMQDPDIL